MMYLDWEARVAAEYILIRGLRKKLKQTTSSQEAEERKSFGLASTHLPAPPRLKSLVPHLVEIHL